MRVCVFVETFEMFTYICIGRQLSNNLFATFAIASVIISRLSLKKQNQYENRIHIRKG